MSDRIKELENENALLKHDCDASAGALRILATALEVESWKAVLEMEAKINTMKKALAYSAGWQPIETAPKDGTIVLLFDPSWYEIPFSGMFKVAKGYWTNFAPGEQAMEFFPTHWMPLPSIADVLRGGQICPEVEG